MGFARTCREDSECGRAFLGGFSNPRLRTHQPSETAIPSIPTSPGFSNHVRTSTPDRLQIDSLSQEAEAERLMSWDYSSGKTAQERHDEQVATNPRLSPDSKEKLEGMLKAKSTPSDRSQSDEYDWVAALQKRHPTLTDEKIEQMADAFGL